MVISASDGPVPEWPDNTDLAFEKAAKQGDLDKLKELVEGGASPDGSGALAMTPLMQAVWNKQYEAARYLIEKGADIHIENIVGQSVFGIAAGIKDPAYLKLLFENADPDKMTFTDEYNPLFIAVKKVLVANVETCIQGGMDVNRKDEHDWTPLHHAYIQDAADIMDVLFKAGAEIPPYFLAFMSNTSTGETYQKALRHIEERTARQTMRMSRLKRANTPGIRA